MTSDRDLHPPAPTHPTCIKPRGTGGGGGVSTAIPGDGSTFPLHSTQPVTPHAITHTTSISITRLLESLLYYPADCVVSVVGGLGFVTAPQSRARLHVLLAWLLVTGPKFFPPFDSTTRTDTALGQLGGTPRTEEHDAWLGEEGWGTGKDDASPPR